jgi:hypothetical protein
MKHEENKTYELIPGEEHEDAWHVRILEGDFIETVLQYGKVSVNEKEGCMTFDFAVISSPNELATSENVDLQICAGDILQECIKSGLEEGSIGLRERDKMKDGTIANKS